MIIKDNPRYNEITYTSNSETIQKEKRSYFIILIGIINILYRVYSYSYKNLFNINKYIKEYILSR